MGFLKKFFRNVFQDELADNGTSSFGQLSEEELEAHLGINRYGNFQLSDAVRPSYDLQVIPSAGYRHDTYRDDDSGSNVPVLMAATSCESIMEVFIDLIEPLGQAVDVVLETSHGKGAAGHNDLYREHIDMPILQSTLWDFEDLLVNDGCTGLAVLNPGVPQEVQLDEHKLLIVYGKELSDFERVLCEFQVPCRNEMQFITEAEHVHSTTDHFIEQFEELKMQLGMDAYR